MSRVGMMLCVICFVIFSPLILLTAIISQCVYLRRVRAAAEQFKCVACGQFLGRKSIELADEEWARHMRELMDRHPGVRFRIVRNLHAICPSCGKQYQFDAKTRTYSEYLPST